MNSTRNSKKIYEALVLIVVLAFICSSANGETLYAQSVLHEIGGWANVGDLRGSPDGQYAYTANSLEQPWAWASLSSGSAVWLDFGRVVHSGTIVVYHDDPGGHYTDLVVGPWYGFCPSVPWPVPLASDVACLQGNIQGSGTVTCYTTPFDFRYVRLDHFTLDSSLQDGIDAVAVIEGVPSGVGIDLVPPPAIEGPAVYAAGQSNNGYWNNPGAVLGAPDGVYAWSSNPSHTMPHLVVDLGRVVYAGTIVIHHDKTHLLKTSLGVSINSQEYDPDPETCPAWPYNMDEWEALWTGHAKGVTTLQFPPTRFRYIQIGQGQCYPGREDGIDAVEVYETPGVPTLIDYEAVDLYEDLSLWDWFAIVRNVVAGLKAVARVSATVSYPEQVESVEVEISGGTRPTFPLSWNGTNYGGNIEFIDLNDARLFWLLSILSVPLPIAWEPEPSVVQAIVITDKAGNSRRYILGLGVTIKNIREHLSQQSTDPPTGMVITYGAYSPVDIVVTKVTDGLRTGTFWGASGPQVLNEISRSLYTGSETHPEFVAIFPDSSDDSSIPYVVDVFGRSTGQYNLVVSTYEDGVFLYHRKHQNMSIQEGEHHLYVELPNAQEDLHDAEVDFKPDAFNLAARRKFVTCYIEPLDSELSDSSGLYELWVTGGTGPIAAETTPRELGDYDNDGNPDVMVKFDGSAVAEQFEHVVGSEGARVVVVGRYDGKPAVAGYDYVRIIK